VMHQDIAINYKKAPLLESSSCKKKTDGADSNKFRLKGPLGMAVNVITMLEIFALVSASQPRDETMLFLLCTLVTQ
jgi:hypothetical protein